MGAILDEHFLDAPVPCSLYSIDGCRGVRSYCYIIILYQETVAPTVSVNSPPQGAMMSHGVFIGHGGLTSGNLWSDLNSGVVHEPTPGQNCSGDRCLPATLVSHGGMPGGCLER